MPTSDLCPVEQSSFLSLTYVFRRIYPVMYLNWRQAKHQIGSINKKIDINKFKVYRYGLFIQQDRNI